MKAREWWVLNRAEEEIIPQEINVPMHRQMVKQIRARIKTKTSRGHQLGEIGNIFMVAEMPCQLVAIEQLRVEEIARDHYKAEGFSSPEEYLAFITMLARGHGIDLKAVRYLHTFARLD
jgi:hypothetical protein